MSLAPVQDPTGKTIGNVAVLRDLSREAEVQRARDALFAVTAHELRTPLNAIINLGKLTRDGLVPPDRNQDTITRIIANGERLLVLANNLLESAQMAAGETSLHVEPFTPADLLDGLTDVVGVLAKQKGLALHTQIADEVPELLQADRRRLHQILVNLVSNAVKFTDEGAVNVRVFMPDVAHWALAVSDTGRGIPAQMQERVFEPFGLAEDPTTRKQAGAGLGLSIVKKMVTLMSGEIMLESEVGKGSTFTVVLPLVQDKAEKPEPIHQILRRGCLGL